MQKRALLLALMLLATNSYANVNFVAVLLCDGESFFNAVVRDCSTDHPELRQEIDIAFSSWRDRNLADANRTKAACEAKGWQADARNEKVSALEIIRPSKESWKNFCQGLPEWLRSTDTSIEPAGRRAFP